MKRTISHSTHVTCVANKQQFCPLGICIRTALVMPVYQADEFLNCQRLGCVSCSGLFEWISFDLKLNKVQENEYLAISNGLSRTDYCCVSPPQTRPRKLTEAQIGWLKFKMSTIKCHHIHININKSMEYIGVCETKHACLALTFNRIKLKSALSFSCSVVICILSSHCAWIIKFFQQFNVVVHYQQKHQKAAHKRRQCWKGRRCKQIISFVDLVQKFFITFY